MQTLDEISSKDRADKEILEWRSLVNFWWEQEDTGLGGKGGERGGQWGRTKNGFGATPYILVIADDQEGWGAFSSVVILSRFLDRLLIICKAQKIVLYLARNKKLLRQFFLSWFGFEIEELHIIIQTLVSLRSTLLYTIIHYYTLLYTIIH
jgi:hypothetical protein